MKRRSSRISKLPANLVVDANPILSAVIGKAAQRVFLCGQVETFATTAWTITEVRRYVPRLAAKAKLSERIVYQALDLLPLTVYEESAYAGFMESASKRIRDPKDVDLLALALTLEWPIWTNDSDFENTGVSFFPSAVLLKFLDRKSDHI